MSNVLKSRKKVLRFEDYMDKLKRKLARIYYIIKNKVSAYSNNIISYKINSFILISIFYRSAVDDPIYDAVYKEVI